MKNLALALVGALLLAGCESAEEQKVRINSQLPAGCHIKDLGSYGRIDSLVVVMCDGQRTTALNYTQSRQAGKMRVTDRFTVLQFDDDQ